MRAVVFKNDIKLSYDIIPNPAGSEGFNLQFNSIADEVYSVEITDLSGRMVYNNQFNLSNSGKVINERFDNGVYILTVRNINTGEPIGTKRLVISEN